MKKVVLLLFVFAIFQWGCENFFKSEVDPPDNATEPRLVVHSYLSPDAPRIKVLVSLSKPIFSNKTSQGNDFKLVKDAKVILSDDLGQSIVLPYLPVDNAYVVSASKFSIKAGGNYKLEVSSSQAPSVSAHCSVPLKRASIIKNIRLVKTTDESKNEAYQVAFEFRDMPNVENYYFARVQAYFYQNGKPAYNQDYAFDVFKDYNRDGEVISVKSKKMHTSYSGRQDLKVILHTIDKNYYEYYRTVSMQEENGDMGPFVEPTVIISNINNGFGVFGGYVEDIALKSF